MVLFGAFDVFDAPFTSRTMPNGAGKTTQVNAWVFALTGRTLNGFQPRRIDPQTGMDTAPEVNTCVNDYGVAYRRHDYTACTHPQGIDAIISVR